jgi:hypothetical protein
MTMEWLDSDDNRGMDDFEIAAADFYSLAISFSSRDVTQPRSCSAQAAARNWRHS